MRDTRSEQAATIRALIVTVVMSLPIWAGVGLMVWQDNPSLMFIGGAVSVFMLVTYGVVIKGLGQGG
jgi:hypothetical protein